LNPPQTAGRQQLLNENSNRGTWAVDGSSRLFIAAGDCLTNYHDFQKSPTNHENTGRCHWL